MFWFRFLLSPQISAIIRRCSYVAVFKIVLPNQSNFSPSRYNQKIPLKNTIGITPLKVMFMKLTLPLCLEEDSWVQLLGLSPSQSSWWYLLFH